MSDKLQELFTALIGFLVLVSSAVILMIYILAVLIAIAAALLIHDAWVVGWV